MSGDDRTSLVMKGIRHGACDYLIKPIRTEELKNIWQHVVRKKCNVGKEHEHSGSLEDNDRLKHGIDEGEYASSVNEGADGTSKTLKKRKDAKEEDDGEIENDDPTTSKKPRVVWSVELHQQFVSAVNHLGIDSMNFRCFAFIIHLVFFFQFSLFLCFIFKVLNRVACGILYLVFFFNIFTAIDFECSCSFPLVSFLQRLCQRGFWN